MISAECSQLISCVKHYPITYARRLFNHLPMTLVALDEMGASSSQLQLTHQRYIQRFTLNSKAKAPCDPISQQFNVLQQQYLFQLQQQGLNQTLKLVLLQLLPGVAAGAFYGLMRLASALKTQDLVEISIAMTCWRIYYLGTEIKPAVDKNPGSILRTMTKIIAHYRFPAGNSIDRMACILTLSCYHETASQPLNISFNIVARALISAYQKTGDFTMHQSVVAVNALRELLPYIDDQELALRYFWQACVIAYLSTGGIQMGAAEPVELIDWDDIRAFCRDCGNEYLIELCCACELLYRQTGDINCHQVASRQVRFNR